MTTVSAENSRRVCKKAASRQTASQHVKRPERNVHDWRGSLSFLPFSTISRLRYRICSAFVRPETTFVSLEWSLRKYSLELLTLVRFACGDIYQDFSLKLSFNLNFS